MEEKLTQLQKKLEADKELGEKLLSLETAEEVQSLLKGAGMDLSLEELNALKDYFIKAVESGELSDEDLEDIAGGSFIDDLRSGYRRELGRFQRSAKPVMRRISDGRW